MIIFRISIVSSALLSAIDLAPSISGICPEGGQLKVPQVGFSISGTKSGADPETLRKHSQSKFRVSRFRTVGDPETLEKKAYSG